MKPRLCFGELKSSCPLSDANSKYDVVVNDLIRTTTRLLKVREVAKRYASGPFQTPGDRSSPRPSFFMASEPLHHAARVEADLGIVTGMREPEKEVGIHVCDRLADSGVIANTLSASESNVMEGDR